MKKLIKAAFIAVIFSIFTGLFGCALPNVNAPEKGLPEKQSTVRYYAIPDGVAQYSRAEVEVYGEKLPVYSVQTNTVQVWTPNNYKRTQSGVVLFELDGYARVTVKPDVQIDYSSKVRPLSANITPIADIEQNTLSFTFESAGSYVLEINGYKDNTIHFFISDYSDERDTTGYSNVITFGAGLHTAENSGYIKADNTVTLNSDTLVYLEDGAVVRAKFVANNASNIAVKGRGIIDGSTFERDAERGSVTVPIDFNYCSGVKLEDFTVLDPAGWCVNFYFTENSDINGVKIITSRSNGDGISLQSCKNITVDGCFVRTWDDTLVVKNYPEWSDRSRHGATDNITFTNCTLWTDLAQSMEIGYETVGERLENVRFENITVLHALHLAPISIHNANNANVKNISYRNITVEDALNVSQTAGIIDIRNLYSENWSEIHTVTPLGTIGGITVENLKVISAKRLSMTLGGCRDGRAGFVSDHYVDGVTVSGVSVAGVSPDTDGLKITSTGYTRNFVYTKGDTEEITGAQFVFSQSEQYLQSFSDVGRVVLGGA